MSDKEYFEIIDGMLFLRGDDGIDLKTIQVVLELDKLSTQILLDKYLEHKRQGDQGIVVVNFNNVYKMATNPKYVAYYQKMADQNKARLSNAALETLAIVAYNQPITRNAIEEIRGVGCDATIRNLVARALIKDYGRADLPGMPILYGVTDEFFDAFNLTSLDELPELEEVHAANNVDIFATRYHETLEDYNEY
ncbi:MAG: SMC-Scp complex subunit ScpB [Erysipelotrichaceae bacterium]|nr:SMC-Scp complex subunit ScpB [Erysipelotrichaceae bacterium]MDD3810353.1 SMC-Scp complex subunit ScpB [Erysipelotrichaceae bacterium]